MNTGRTSTPGTLLTSLPIPGRNAATIPGSPRLPSGKKMSDSPCWSASMIGESTSRPAGAVRSMPIAFIQTIDRFRRNPVWPK